MFGFKSSKCKTACKLCVSRIKLLRNKREIQFTQQRRQIGQLLQEGKNEYAWIRVEAVIREKNTLAAYEILELYLELISVRVELLAKNRDMVEAVTTLMYAAPRVADLPELVEVRKWLSMKFGSELGVEGARSYDGMEPPAWQVNLRLRQYLAVEAPEPEDKLSMISHIAQETGTKFNLEDYAQSVMVQMDPIGEAPIQQSAAQLYAGAGSSVPPQYLPTTMMPTVIPARPPPNYEPDSDGPVLPPAQPSFRKPYQGQQQTKPTSLDDELEAYFDPSAPKKPLEEDGKSYDELQKQYDSMPGPAKKHHEEEEPLPPSAPPEDELGIDEDLTRRLSDLRKGL